MICCAKNTLRWFCGVQVAFALFWASFAFTACLQKWQENFDGQITPIGSAIVHNPLVMLVKGLGVGGSNAVQVTYQGYERGSKLVKVRSALPQMSMNCTLSFAVKFCEGFDFAKGGKLHGLGPRRSVTGGNPVTPQGWSVRMMFRPGGGLMTYVYHQDMRGKYGDSKRAPAFRFKPGQYYRIDMRVTLNEPASAANGNVEIWVDGQEIIKHTGLRFRALEGQDGMIQTLLFSTFHGGHSPEWAPRMADGTYKTDCAFFDNWEVSQ